MSKKTEVPLKFVNFHCQISPVARQKLRKKIPVLNLAEVRRFRQPLHEALLLELDEGCYKNAQIFFKELVDHDLNLFTKVFTNDNELLKIVFDGLREAEYIPKKDEIEILLKLGANVEERKIKDLFWLSVKIYQRALSLIRIYKLNRCRIDATAKFYYGKLLTNDNESLEEGISFLEQAYEISYRVDDQESQTLNFLISTHLCDSLLRLSKKKQIDNPEKALVLAKKSMKIIREIGNGKDSHSMLEVESEMEIANSFKAMNQLKEALFHFEQAFLLSSKKELFGLAFDALMKISENYESVANEEDYESTLKRARNLANQNKLPESEAKVLMSLGQFWIRRRDFVKAKIYLADAADIYNQVGDRNNLQYVRFLMGPLKELASLAQETFNDLVDTILKSDKGVPGKNIYLDRLLLWYDRKYEIKNQHHEFYRDSNESLEDFIAKFYDPDEVTRTA